MLPLCNDKSFAGNKIILPSEKKFMVRNLLVGYIYTLRKSFFFIGKIPLLSAISQSWPLSVIKKSRSAEPLYSP